MVKIFLLTSGEDLGISRSGAEEAEYDESWKEGSSLLLGSLIYDRCWNRVRSLGQKSVCRLQDGTRTEIHQQNAQTGDLAVVHGDGDGWMIENVRCLTKDSDNFMFLNPRGDGVGIKGCMRD